MEASADPRQRDGSPKDRAWWKRDNWYRDIWSFLLTLFVGWTAITSYSAATDARDAGNDARAAGNAAKAASTKALRASLDAKAASGRAKHTADQIQASRIRITRENCESQNRRHDETVKRLRRLVADTVDPQERARSQRNIGATISLIDALVPKQNCKALIVHRIKLKPTH